MPRTIAMFCAIADATIAGSALPKSVVLICLNQVATKNPVVVVQVVSTATRVKKCRQSNCS
jgi:hypothetical protein